MEGEIVYEITTSPLSTGQVSHLQINISTDTMSAKLLVHFSRKKKMVTLVLMVLVRVRDSKLKSVRLKTVIFC